jgi:hypothetical protein
VVQLFPQLRGNLQDSLFGKIFYEVVNDKVCEQVSMTMLQDVYPKAVIERCVQQSEPWSSKARRVRLSTALALVLFVIAMALWSRLNQCQVWHKLVGKLSDLHPAEPESALSDAGLSGRRQTLGSQCLQALMRERCQVIAKRASMRSRLLWSLSAHGY